ncbi:hypothetical protein BD1_38 [Octadecabacter Antarctic BD virus 1]|nr:hypothetical protein BD1_38 [Octadecabacter Antarctic BD virus 1]
MSGNSLGEVAAVQKGRGKVHVLDTYNSARYRLSDTSTTRCGKPAQGWARLSDVHCLSYLNDPQSCAACVRMLKED